MLTHSFAISDGTPLDSVPPSWVGSPREEWGGIIPHEAPKSHDFKRLERAVAALVETHERMQKDNDELRDRVAENATRIRTLEEQLLEANQRRQDVAKRIDELIAQLDQLDTQLGSLED